jgi:hypothetical protein
MFQSDNATRLLGLLVLALFLVLSGVRCRDVGTETTGDNGVTILAGRSSVLVTNFTPNKINYFAVEKQSSAFIDWITQCDDGTAILPHHSKEIAYSNILGYHQPCDILFYWWHCVPTPNGGTRPDSLRELIVRSQ